MDKWCRVRVRVRIRARAIGLGPGNTVHPFFSLHFFFSRLSSLTW